MFTSFTLTEIARQRQSVLMACSDRYRLTRRSSKNASQSKNASETYGSVVEMPRPRARTVAGEALVA